MNLPKPESLIELTSQLRHEKSLSEVVVLCARYLEKYNPDYLIAILTSDGQSMPGTKKQKIDIDFIMKENWEQKTHTYSSRKHGYRIQIPKYTIYLESKSLFSEEESLLFTFVENILTLCSASKKESTTVVVSDNNIKTRKELKFPYKNIIGESPLLLQELAKLDKIIPSEVSILIQGQSGTGKELIAQAIHMYGPRKEQPFVSENCAAIAETLLESELFGHVKGSFTGAFKDRQGLFEIAHKGTLFLDEMGDMSQGMQKKLLRALQDGEIRPVGAKSIKKVDVRIITATNKNLQEEVAKNNFREDLFYRLNVVTIHLPPLKNRGTDILLLLDFFHKKFCHEMGLQPKKIEDHVKSLFLAYNWPGNIRELQNEVRRMLALSDDVIDTDIVSDNIRQY